MKPKNNNLSQKREKQRTCQTIAKRWMVCCQANGKSHDYGTSFQKGESCLPFSQ